MESKLLLLVHCWFIRVHGSVFLFLEEFVPVFFHFLHKEFLYSPSFFQTLPRFLEAGATLQRGSCQELGQTCLPSSDEQVRSLCFSMRHHRGSGGGEGWKREEGASVFFSF